MACMEKRNGIYRVVFRFGGQKYSRSLRTRDRIKANAALARLEDNLSRVELGVLSIPDSADVALFLLSDGRLKKRPRQGPKPHTLGKLCKDFLESLDTGSIEASTESCLRIHIRHLKRHLGTSLELRELQLSDLQAYVAARARCRGRRGGQLSPVTIAKEVATLNMIWQWGINSGYATKPLPKRGLRYPKIAEKPPFITIDEAERRIARGGLSTEQHEELWDSVFLTIEEIDELLADVKKSVADGFQFPMFVFAAHTGARRSEMLRSQIDDIDFRTCSIVINERKRVRGIRSTRRVPMSPYLEQILKQWLGKHPGSQHTFFISSANSKSRKMRSGPMAITWQEARHYFHQTLQGTRWRNLRGWHVFRHSFCSNRAARGIDQRIINAWVGHQTEEMVRRYRHLIPNQQQAAIRQVFDGQPKEGP